MVIASGYSGAGRLSSRALLALLALYAAVSLCAAFVPSAAFAQDPDEQVSTPDGYGGEAVRCELALGDEGRLPQDSLEPGAEHDVDHRCAASHTHGRLNLGNPRDGLHTHAHIHKKAAVSAGNVSYAPREILPDEEYYMEEAVITGPRRCSEPQARPGPNKRGEGWDMLNCEVKRSVEWVVAAIVGISVMGVAWGGIHIITSGGSEERGRGKQIILSSVLGLVVGICCYIFAGLIDLGVSIHVPWDVMIRGG